MRWRLGTRRGMKFRASWLRMGNGFARFGCICLSGMGERGRGMYLELIIELCCILQTSWCDM